jgi:hypothetical protein
MNLVYTHGKTAHDKKRIHIEDTEGRLNLGRWRPNFLSSCAQFINDETGEFILIQSKETADRIEEMERNHGF